LPSRPLSSIRELEAEDGKEEQGEGAQAQDAQGSRSQQEFLVVKMTDAFITGV
jgi:hypothetical protein